MTKQFSPIKHDLAKKIEKICKKTLNGPNKIMKSMNIQCIKDQYYYVDLIDKHKKIVYEVKYLNPKWHGFHTITYEVNKIQKFFKKHKPKGYKMYYVIFSNQQLYLYEIKGDSFKSFKTTNNLQDRKKGLCFSIQWTDLKKYKSQPKYNKLLQEEIVNSFK